MKNSIIFLLIFLVIGCADKNFVKDFGKNIDEFNDFYESGDNDLNQKLLVFSSGNVEEEPKRTCAKANIKANNISLRELIKLLSKLYNTNINYSSDINVEAKGQEVPDDVAKLQELLKEDKASKPADSSDPKNISGKNSQNNPAKIPEHNKIYLNMNDVCLQDVFDNLTESYDIGVEKYPYGYTIYTKGLRTQTFVVDYHNFYRQGKSSAAIVNSQLKTEGNADQQSYSEISSEYDETFWASITKTIRSILSSDRARKVLNQESGGGSSSGGSALTPSDQQLEDFYVYKESGLIVVTAYPKQLKYIKEFLSKVTKDSTRQVLIEAKILEVELNEEFANGIQWDLLRKKLYYSSFGSTSNGVPTIGDAHNTQNFAATSPLASSIVSAKINDKNKFNVVMQALSSQGKLSVMSSPRILVLNNQRALIKSGDERYFVTNVTNLTLAAPNSTTGTSSQSGFDLQPYFSGLALDTTARVINNRELLLHIHPMISRVTDENKLITIDNKDTKIPVAMIQSREADTVVKALSGDIIILGGMTQNLVQLNETGLPVNKSGGRLGKVLDLFSTKNHTSRKVELIILLKPTIINNNDNLNMDNIGTYKMVE